MNQNNDMTIDTISNLPGPILQPSPFVLVETTASAFVLLILSAAVVVVLPPPNPDMMYVANPFMSALLAEESAVALAGDKDTVLVPSTITSPDVSAL